MKDRSIDQLTDLLRRVDEHRAERWVSLVLRMRDARKAHEVSGSTRNLYHYSRAHRVFASWHRRRQLVTSAVDHYLREAERG